MNFLREGRRPLAVPCRRRARTASSASRSGDRRTQVPQHVRQHDRVGEAVRRVVAAAQLVRDGVHVAHVGAREREARVRRPRATSARAPPGSCRRRRPCAGCRRSSPRRRAPCGRCGRWPNARRTPRPRGSAHPCRWLPSPCAAGRSSAPGRAPPSPAPAGCRRSPACAGSAGRTRPPRPSPRSRCRRWSAPRTAGTGACRPRK